MTKQEVEQIIFDYLKENMQIYIDCRESYGYYESDTYIKTDYSISLTNPSNNSSETIYSNKSTGW